MAPRKLLIVDDDPNLAELFRLFLTRRGFVVEVAHDAQVALEAMRSDHFPIVLTDIRMPGMSGVELLRAIKRDNPLTIVIVMTGYFDPSAVVDCIGEGAFDYIVKPIRDLEELAALVQEAERKVVRWMSALRRSAYATVPQRDAANAAQ